MTPAPLFEGTGFFQKPPGGEAVRLVAEDDVALRAAFWPGGERGTVLHLQGRSEFIEKHYEPIGRLLKLGFSVATLDWRGQGLSERLLKDRRKGHVERFAHFQWDLDALAAEARRRELPQPWIFFAHSMGGAIVARALMRQAETPAPRWRAKAAVLSAPMLGLSGSRAYLGFGAMLAAGACGFGYGEEYAPGGGPDFYANQGFDGNVITSDPQRFAAYAEFLNAHPELGIGGPTLRWLHEAFREMPQLVPTRTPTLLLLGADEALVSPRAIRAYARDGLNTQLAELDDSRHEPLMETDFVQAQLWPIVDKFLRGQGV